MIIHIAGPEASGKTTLGNKLKKYNVIIKDLDELRQEFYNKLTRIPTNYKKMYQKYIDDFIKENENKTIIFVGLNTYIQNEKFMFKDKLILYPKTTFDLHSNYNYYITLPIKENYKQLYNREFDNHINWYCNWIKNRKDIIFNNIVKNEKEALKDLNIAFNRLFKYSDFKSRVNKWNSFYKNKKYIFLSANEIYNKIKLKL